MNLKFAKSRNIDPVLSSNKKNVKDESSDSSSIRKSADIKLNKQPSNPQQYSKRKRILSTSDFSRVDPSESAIEESVSGISRMNSLTKKFFRAESTIPFRIAESSKNIIIKPTKM